MTSRDAEVERLRCELERERRARLAAEQAGLETTTELRRAVRRLEGVEAELRERIELTDLSYTLARTLRTDLDPASMMERAVGALARALDVDRGLIRVADGAIVGSEVTQWVADGATRLPLDTQLDDGFRALVTDHAARKEPLWITDVTDDDRVHDGAELARRLHCRGYAGVPLTAGTELIGWLALHTEHQPHRWTRRQRAIAAALAHDLSGALMQARTHQRQVDIVRELQQVDEVKNEFVWRVSHELRTPLTSIRGYTELLAMGEVGEPTPAQARTLDVILRNCQRLLGLVENLLSLSRADNHATPSRDPVDLDALMERVRSRATDMVGQRTLVLDLPQEQAGVAGLRGDASELEKVLVNLLGNAVKFTPDGGRVSLSVEVVNGTVVFGVADTGCGIETSDHERVFERFYRTRQAQAAEIPGAGLGLALVDSIVRAHGGTVGVDSRPGAGATFRVSLPVSLA